MKKILLCGGALAGFVWCCGTDTSLREYLGASFWLPFSRNGSHFVKKGITRHSAPYAGMQRSDQTTPMGRLRCLYQIGQDPNMETVKSSLAAARAVPNLTREEKDEIEVIDAKLDMRAGSAEHPELLLRARKKFQVIARTSRSANYRSEARGWIAYTHYLLDERTQAGKIYLDELNRKDSNLSVDTLVNSLRMNYGYDGERAQLSKHLEEYFDTPAHAAFAIQMITNPRWKRFPDWEFEESKEDEPEPLPYVRVKKLLEKHAALLRTENGANSLAVLSMRVALRAGDPAAALRLTESIEPTATVRNDPDFLWMLGSARFLVSDFQGAEEPLLLLHTSARSSADHKAAAAYGLCGVYSKLGNPVEQLRVALWLQSLPPEIRGGDSGITQIEDRSLYWNYSGFDLGELLDAEAPIPALQEFIEKYPRARELRLVRYSLGVRLARENRYDEAAQAFDSIGAGLRSSRMKQLGKLYAASTRADASPQEILQAKYRLATYLSENSDRLYFNDRLWRGYQRYALRSEKEFRMTREERDRQVALERKLRDDQEEFWRAHLLFREVVDGAGRSGLGRNAALQAIRCVRRLSDRFGREQEIRQADIDLSRWLRAAQ